MSTRRGKYHAQHQKMRAERWRKEKYPGSTTRYRVVSSSGKVHGIYEKAEADRVLRLLKAQQRR